MSAQQKDSSSSTMTVVYRDLSKNEIEAIMQHPKARWFGWCHAPYERDEARFRVQQLQSEALSKHQCGVPDWRDTLVANLLRFGTTLTKSQIRELIDAAFCGRQPDECVFQKDAEQKAGRFVTISVQHDTETNDYYPVVEPNRNCNT
jgi:hypothetical protein